MEISKRRKHFCAIPAAADYGQRIEGWQSPWPSRRFASPIWAGDAVSGWEDGQSPDAGGFGQRNPTFFGDARNILKTRAARYAIAVWMDCFLAGDPASPGDGMSAASVRLPELERGASYTGEAYDGPRLMPYSNSQATMSCRDAHTNWPPVKRMSSDTSPEMKEGSVKLSASAAESNSASARSRPSNAPWNTSIPNGGMLYRVLRSVFAESCASIPNSSLVRYMDVMKPCCAPVVRADTFCVNLKREGPPSSHCSRRRRVVPSI